MKNFKVYQLPAEHAAKFMRLSFVKEHNIMPKLEDYKLVYEGELDDDNQVSEIYDLDTIYGRFQGVKPEGYKGTSISVSDIVFIYEKYYYCDSCGWKEISFQPQNTITFASEDVPQEEIDLEENGNRCVGETPEMKVRIAEARRMKRYQELVINHPGAMLLFRCGDFYATYYGDAITAAKVLGITLTHRQGFGKGHELAGFPHNALDIYLPKLIRAGLKVVIVGE